MRELRATFRREPIRNGPGTNKDTWNWFIRRPLQCTFSEMTETIWRELSMSVETKMNHICLWEKFNKTKPSVRADSSSFGNPVDNAIYAIK